MLQTDGPYRNTRSSSSGSQGKASEKISTIENSAKKNKDSVFRQNTTDKEQDNDREITRNRERIRTPSGHLTTTSVGDIRNFFSKTSQNGNFTPPSFKTYSQHRSIGKISTNDSQGRDSKLDRVSQPCTHMHNFDRNGANSHASPILKDNNPIQSKCDKLQRHQQTAKTVWIEGGNCQLQPPDQTCQINSKQRINFNEEIDCNQTDEQFADFNTKQTTAGRACNINREVDMDPKQSLEDVLGEPEEITTDPKVMDLQIVMQMFREIKQDLNQFKKDVPTEDLKALISEKQESSNTIKKLENKLEKQQQSNKVMSGTIIRMSKEMEEMKSRLNELEKSGNRTNLMIYGFKLIAAKKERHEMLKKFLKDTMNVNVAVEDSYYVGEGDQKPLIMCFASVADRNKVFYSKTKLKDYVNEMDKPFYIKEMLPAAINEQKRKERAIFLQNSRNTASKIEMSFFRGNLRIQNEPYVEKVREPKPEDFLQLNDQDLKDIMSTKIQVGKQITQTASTFTGYAINATTHKQIRKAYIRMKLAFPQARHIMCAYIIPGTAEYYAENSCDDGEYAGGQAILDLLKEEGYKNCAVFVVRYYGGIKLGRQRFDIIKQDALYVLQKLEGVIKEVKNKDERARNGQQKEKKKGQIYNFPSQMPSEDTEAQETIFQFANPTQNTMAKQIEGQANG